MINESVKKKIESIVDRCGYEIKHFPELKQADIDYYSKRCAEEGYALASEDQCNCMEHKEVIDLLQSENARLKDKLKIALNVLEKISSRTMSQYVDYEHMIKDFYAISREAIKEVKSDK